MKRIVSKVTGIILKVLAIAILALFTFSDPEKLKPWLDKHLPGADLMSPPHAWYDWVIIALATLLMVMAFEFFEAQKKKRQKKQRGY